MILKNLFKSNPVNEIQKNRNSISFDDWVKLDLEYIEKRSLWLDAKILFKGMYMVLFDHSGK